MSGSSYIPLPKFIADKKAVINVENEHNQCFKIMVFVKNPQRITKILKYQSEKLNFDNIKFPVEFDGINKFEKLNEEIQSTC